MNLRRPLIAALAAAAFALPAQAAKFQNGSFEDIVAGWSADDSLIATFTEFNHRDAAGDVTHTFTPVDGDLLAVLTSPYEPAGTFLISQSFSTIGGVFSGWAGFSAGDALPWNDLAFVRLVGAGGTIDLFGADVAGVGDYGFAPWVQFSTVLAAGDYTFEAGLTNGTDEYDPSFLILDGITMAEVPEPATWALMLGGFFGLGAALRQRRRAFNPS